MKRTKKHRTYLTYALAIKEFRAMLCSGKVFMDEITLSDLQKYEELMIEKRTDRTINNQLSNLGNVLRQNGVDLSLTHAYTKKKVRAYGEEKLNALLDASTDEEKQIWKFFYGSGFREAEVSVAAYLHIPGHVNKDSGVM